MSRNKKRRRNDAPNDSEPLNDAFACLDSLNLELPEMETHSEELETEQECDYPQLTGTVIKIRIEKKGRGGKTVTVLYDLPDDCDDVLMILARDLKKQIATGGSYIEGNIELQGDVRPKLRKWLEAKKIVFKGDL